MSTTSDRKLKKKANQTLLPFTSGLSGGEGKGEEHLLQWIKGERREGGGGGICVNNYLLSLSFAEIMKDLKVKEKEKEGKSTTCH